MIVTIREFEVQSELSHLDLAPDEGTDLRRQIAGKRIQGPQRRKVAPLSVAAELEHAERATEVAQAVLTQIRQPHPCGKHFLHKRFRRT